MNEILNFYQRRSITIVLKTFEESLRKADAWLHSTGEAGILYQRELQLSAQEKMSIQARIAESLVEIEKLAKDLGLEQDDEDPARLIRSEMYVNWANLVDTRSDKLNRFGEVDPGLSQILDPAIQKLANLALELGSIFDHHSTT